MKFAWLFNTVLAGIILAGSYGCEKHGNQSLPNNVPVTGGKGGLATLRVTAIRDSFEIDSCKIYIKYNEIVETGKYDDSGACTYVDGKPAFVDFPGLKKGNYFLSVKGWDLIKSKIVTGTYAYTLAKDTTAVFYIQLPVH
jgi:hypothetical protein